MMLIKVLCLQASKRQNGEGKEKFNLLQFSCMFKLAFILSDLTWISEYLNRINLYRQRIWMCKVSGKTNLTYEEALLSEEHATEKTHMFPKELMAPALQIIQYSKN